MKKGVSDITLYLGDAPVNNAYKGDTEVYTGDVSYDAEVEYLESTGTQYINVGLKPTPSDVITITFKATENQSTCFVGCRTSSSAGKCVIGSGTNNTKFYAALGSNANQTLSSFGLTQHTISLNLSTGEASFDGGNPVSVGMFSDNNLNIYLFACNQAGTASLLSKIQVTSVQIGTRAKLIPVRVGTVGYMYDEIRGILLGNLGTGNFIVGNDV